MSGLRDQVELMVDQIEKLNRLVRALQHELADLKRPLPMCPRCAGTGTPRCGAPPGSRSVWGVP